MGAGKSRRHTGVLAAVALSAGFCAAVAVAGPAAAATGSVVVVQKGSTGSLVSTQAFAFVSGITEQRDGVQAGATQFAVTNATNTTLTLTEETAAGAVVHSATVASGASGTLAVTAGDTVVLTVPPS